jgi:hypothetical protein
VSAPRPARRFRQEATEPGAKTSLEKPSRQRPGRSRHETETALAALSGVGKHTARESERAQCRATGKECVASTHPQIWPQDRKVLGPYSFRPETQRVGRENFRPGAIRRPKYYPLQPGVLP